VNELPAWLKHGTVWLLLGVAMFLGVQAWQSSRQAARFATDGGTVTLQRAADGHYHWPGRLNGRSIEFLVDTGASRSAIPQALAGELGLVGQGEVRSDTAGGVVTGQLVRADLELRGGVHAERLRMVALPGLSGPLLGMDVLGRLRLAQRDGVLSIELGEGSRP
jgi:aspartyl protease family protein